MRRKITMTAATGAALVLGLAACGGGGAGSTEGDGEAPAAEDVTVGVAMPTETSERWIQDGDAVKAGLEELGYQVDLQYAGDDIPTQTQQIDSMITAGADVLIIAAIDGTALSSQLDAAAAADIPVISYDRLIRDSENVDFYVTFDNYAVGVAQANGLLAGLGLTDWAGEPAEDAPEGPFNVELFAGSLDDNNAHFFWQGAMDTLEPFMEDGTIVVPSEQTDIEQAATLRWSQETAQKRMEDLLTSTYSGDTELHGVLSPYDGISRGIITALQGVGMGPSLEDGLPVVTGQDAEIASVKLIQDGIQSSTIFKDTRKLADQSVVAVESFVNGEEPEANDTETYDNGVKVVPSYLLTVDTVHADNITELLVDSGYWTQDEIDEGVAE
ncbi:multiple monosaccharide ABC transporter substrate-binding protein [Cellulomonas oligotrophica]|uniref:Putative multiple sugar transport system substrate-binding protein n=1 Tax=Cellulomonas oligotrophica TaxID=931536 RepID=A0A7Y9FDU3_9CELL|nr:multiple monosaccharide ABC transporter substrate-binding protein [Cellulomonas oligotrophica]NYD85395.1 putative multiple sugar transport system substrate-binding protein [Cellulomonas oligotrophica]GIG33170.1 sugar ABC transporter substrate-binding protein [Cellulomonas oligotrophica]